MSSNSTALRARGHYRADGQAFWLVSRGAGLHWYARVAGYPGLYAIRFRRTATGELQVIGLPDAPTWCPVAEGEQAVG